VGRSIRKFEPIEIESELNRLEGWSFDGKQICKRFEFDCYQKGLVFATHVGLLADRLDHHPDLFIGYRKVIVKLNTHDVDGISELDFQLATAIEG
jgi:4a-hydroxytetrahydrobiopterin dehydratase